MNKQMHRWIDDQFAVAEENKTCLAATTRRERERLHRAVEDGRVLEVAPSVFSRSEYWESLKPASRMQHKMAALQVLHPNWVFAGPSAGVAWGLAISNRYLDKVWVASSRKAHGRESHYRRNIIFSEVAAEDKDGLRLTPLVRTAGDCLRVMDFRSGLAVADSTLRAANVSSDSLVDKLEHVCKRMTGAKRIRAVAALADARAESGGESVARATMLELGLALPDLQRKFDDPLSPGESYRVDFAWDVMKKSIVGELDGFEKYENQTMTKGRTVAQVIEDEHRRQSHLEACPEIDRIVRFGYADVMRTKSFLDLLLECGVPRTYACDSAVIAAGGVLRCRS